MFSRNLNPKQMGSFKKISNSFTDNDNFVLICHIDPDGDAVGSMLALGKALLKLKKKVSFVSKCTVPEVFKFLVDEEISQTLPASFDVVVLLDCGDFRRTGFSEELRVAKEAGKIIVNIDHHSKNDIWKFANINYVNEESSSTAEIIYNLIIGLKYEISPDIATALLAGIYTDTGGFKHSNTKSAVLEIVSDLLKRGGKLKKIAENVELQKPISLFRLWGIALSRLEINQKYGIALSYITQEDLQNSNSTEEEVSGLVNLLNSTSEAQIAMLLYEAKDDKIKGSIRTEKDDIDVSKLAAVFGGGGHKKAAGFEIEGKFLLKNGKLKII